MPKGAETGQRKKIFLDFNGGHEYNRDCSTIAEPGPPSREPGEAGEKKTGRGAKLGVPVSSKECTYLYNGW